MIGFLAANWWVFLIGIVGFAIATVVTGLNFKSTAGAGIAAISDILAAGDDDDDEAAEKAIDTGKKTVSRSGMKLALAMVFGVCSWICVGLTVIGGIAAIIDYSKATS